MARLARIELGIINIAADPHPDGTYQRLFKEVANKPIALNATDMGKITDPEVRSDGKLIGRVLVWTPIEKGGAWINLDTNNEATEADKRTITLNERIQPHYRAFTYVFDLSTHRLFIEYKNEFGHQFGPARAEKFFINLFAPPNLWEDAPNISVTVIPEDNSLDLIFAIPRLKKLQITVLRPNPEDTVDKVDEVLRRLQKQGAKSQTFELVKAPKIPSLTPDDETIALAQVAATNGHVKGQGLDEEGNPVVESTKAHPKKISIEIPAEGVLLATILSNVARL